MTPVALSRQRLLNLSRTQGRPFQGISFNILPWSDFCIDSQNLPYAGRFILKGALLLTAWRAPLSRPTMDIDLAGRTNKSAGSCKRNRRRTGRCDIARWAPMASNLTALPIDVEKPN